MGQTADSENRERILQFREIVANSLGVIRSEEKTRTYVSVSIEELADRRIEQLTGGDDLLTPSRRAKAQKIYDDLVNHIEEIKATDPSNFRRPNPNDDANTDV